LLETLRKLVDEIKSVAKNLRGFSGILNRSSRPPTATAVVALTADDEPVILNMAAACSLRSRA
jgi:hypothetical protein